MLKAALNIVTNLHSRPATLKRLGNPDIFSACRITPSNYFRFLRGPEYTTVRGVEFIIPVDSMLGSFAQTVKFTAEPTVGDFKVKFGSLETTLLPYTATAADIQAALRVHTPLSNILVTGNFSQGFRFTFVGFQTRPGIGQIIDSSLATIDGPVTEVWAATTTPWTELLKKGDRLTDGTQHWAVDEIMAMPDLGGQTMAFRVRCD